MPGRAGCQDHQEEPEPALLSGCCASMADRAQDTGNATECDLCEERDYPPPLGGKMGQITEGFLKEVQRQRRRQETVGTAWQLQQVWPEGLGLLLPETWAPNPLWPGRKVGEGHSPVAALGPHFALIKSGGPPLSSPYHCR